MSSTAEPSEPDSGFTGAAGSTAPDELLQRWHQAVEDLGLLPGWLLWEPRMDLLWASPPCSPALEVSGVHLGTEEIRTALAGLTDAGYEFSIHRGADGECSVRVPNLPPCQNVSSVKWWPTATAGGLAGVYLDQNILIRAALPPVQPEAPGGSQ